MSQNKKNANRRTSTGKRSHMQNPEQCERNNNVQKELHSTKTGQHSRNYDFQNEYVRSTNLRKELEAQVLLSTTSTMNMSNTGHVGNNNFQKQLHISPPNIVPPISILRVGHYLRNTDFPEEVHNVQQYQVKNNIPHDQYMVNNNSTQSLSYVNNHNNTNNKTVKYVSNGNNSFQSVPYPVVNNPNVAIVQYPVNNNGTVQSFQIPINNNGSNIQSFQYSNIPIVQYPQRIIMCNPNNVPKNPTYILNNANVVVPHHVPPVYNEKNWNPSRKSPVDDARCTDSVKEVANALVSLQYSTKQPSPTISPEHQPSVSDNTTNRENNDKNGYNNRADDSNKITLERRLSCERPKETEDVNKDAEPEGIREVPENTATSQLQKLLTRMPEDVNRDVEPGGIQEVLENTATSELHKLLTGVTEAKANGAEVAKPSSKRRRVKYMPRNTKTAEKILPTVVETKAPIEKREICNYKGPYFKQYTSQCSHDNNNADNNTSNVAILDVSEDRSIVANVDDKTKYPVDDVHTNKPKTHSSSTADSSKAFRNSSVSSPKPEDRIDVIDIIDSDSSLDCFEVPIETQSTVSDNKKYDAIKSKNITNEENPVNGIKKVSKDVQNERNEESTLPAEKNPRRSFSSVSSNRSEESDNNNLHKTRLYACDTCKNKFDEKHISTCEDNAPRYCNACSLAFASPPNILKIEVTPDYTLRYPCSSCDKTFDSVVDLEKHVENCIVAVKSNDCPNKSLPCLDSENDDGYLAKTNKDSETTSSANGNLQTAKNNDLPDLNSPTDFGLYLEQNVMCKIYQYDVDVIKKKEVKTLKFKGMLFNKADVSEVLNDSERSKTDKTSNTLEPNEEIPNIKTEIIDSTNIPEDNFPGKVPIAPEIKIITPKTIEIENAVSDENVSETEEEILNIPESIDYSSILPDATSNSVDKTSNVREKDADLPGESKSSNALEKDDGAPDNRNKIKTMADIEEEILKMHEERPSTPPERESATLKSVEKTSNVCEKDAESHEKSKDKSITKEAESISITSERIESTLSSFERKGEISNALKSIKSVSNTHKRKSSTPTTLEDKASLEKYKKIEETLNMFDSMEEISNILEGATETSDKLKEKPEAQKRMNINETPQTAPETTLKRNVFGVCENVEIVEKFFNPNDAKSHTSNKKFEATVVSNRTNRSHDPLKPKPLSNGKTNAQSKIDKVMKKHDSLFEVPKNDVKSPKKGIPDNLKNNIKVPNNNESFNNKNTPVKNVDSPKSKSNRGTAVVGNQVSSNRPVREKIRNPSKNLQSVQPTNNKIIQNGHKKNNLLKKENTPAKVNIEKENDVYLFDNSCSDNDEVPVKKINKNQKKNKTVTEKTQKHKSTLNTDTISNTKILKSTIKKKTATKTIAGKEPKNNEEPKINNNKEEASKIKVSKSLKINDNKKQEKVSPPPKKKAKMSQSKNIVEKDVLKIDNVKKSVDNNNKTMQTPRKSSHGSVNSEKLTTTKSNDTQTSKTISDNLTSNNNLPNKTIPTLLKKDNNSVNKTITENVITTSTKGTDLFIQPSKDVVMRRHSTSHENDKLIKIVNNNGNKTIKEPLKTVLPKIKRKLSAPCGNETVTTPNDAKKLKLNIPNEPLTNDKESPKPIKFTKIVDSSIREKKNDPEIQKNNAVLKEDEYPEVFRCERNDSFKKIKERTKSVDDRTIIESNKRIKVTQMQVPIENRIFTFPKAIATIQDNNKNICTVDKIDKPTNVEVKTSPIIINNRNTLNEKSNLNKVLNVKAACEVLAKDSHQKSNVNKVLIPKVASEVSANVNVNKVLISKVASEVSAKDPHQKSNVNKVLISKVASEVSAKDSHQKSNVNKVLIPKVLSEVSAKDPHQKSNVNKVLISKVPSEVSSKDSHQKNSQIVPEIKKDTVHKYQPPIDSVKSNVKTEHADTKVMNVQNEPKDKKLTCVKNLSIRISQNEKQVADELLVMCNVCGLKSSNCSVHAEHLKTHKPRNNDPRERAKSCEANDPLVTCNVCGRRSRNGADHAEHLKTHRNHYNNNNNNDPRERTPSSEPKKQQSVYEKSNVVRDDTPSESLLKLMPQALCNTNNFKNNNNNYNYRREQPYHRITYRQYPNKYKPENPIPMFNKSKPEFQQCFKCNKKISDTKVFELHSLKHYKEELDGIDSKRQNGSCATTTYKNTIVLQPRYNERNHWQQRNCPTDYIWKCRKCNAKFMSHGVFLAHINQRDCNNGNFNFY